MTAEEYLARPEDPRERGWELISGELIDMTDPSLPHELVRMEILHALAAVVARRARARARDRLDRRADRPRATSTVPTSSGTGRIASPPRDDAAPVRRPRPRRRGPLAEHLALRHRRQEVRLRARAAFPSCGSSTPRPTRCSCSAARTPDAPEFDVALELTRGDTLTSPLLPGFAPGARRRLRGVAPCGHRRRSSSCATSRTTTTATGSRPTAPATTTTCARPGRRSPRASPTSASRASSGPTTTRASTSARR